LRQSGTRWRLRPRAPLGRISSGSECGLAAWDDVATPIPNPQEILDAVESIGAKRLVIDSLVNLEMALAPGFREDFRESLYRMIVALTGSGVTILSTVEVEDTFTGFSFSH
jgi:hypothetical protein